MAVNRLRFGYGWTVNRLHFLVIERALCVTHIWLFEQAYKRKTGVLAAIVILSNVYRAWTMYLCMDSIKFLSDAPGASIL